MTRRAAVVKVQIARRDLALDEDTYRAMLARLTGQTSASACTDAQLGRVLDELKAKGWAPKVIAGGRKAPRAKPAAADQAVAKKARALWISLHQLGAVRDPSEAALEAFARRQLGVERLRWAVASEAYSLIEALKKMAERAGWSQDLSGVPAARHVAVLKARLAAAIAAREAAQE
ncbi:gp16 family protein [Brevundimonas faecalis]|uniref:gp16 family protein n=1 Tax=Brevundimonas faecalis TaxID=947378 RepID=UPI003623C054